MKSPRTILALVCLHVSLIAPSAWAVAIVPGFDSNALARNDDASTGAVSIGFNINFLGSIYSELYVNNNGNVTFGSSLSSYTPFNLATGNRAIIAPFFADVDTRAAGSALTSYGAGVFEGHDAFGVTWNGVGYHSYYTDKLNAFQLLLVDRSDTGAGNFDIYFNYDQIQWETGDASDGFLGLGGFSARAGYSSGDSSGSYELPGSAVPGAFLDKGSDSLAAGGNIGSAGRYLFEIRNGIPVPDSASTAFLLTLVLSVLFPLRSLFEQTDTAS